MLDSFEIENFRTFRRLEIPRLGRVNLIVGKNGVGKTTLLEALWLYAARMDADAICEVLRSRDEFEADRFTGDAAFSLSSLFHGRQSLGSPQDSIYLGTCDSLKDRLVLSPWECNQNEKKDCDEAVTDLRVCILRQGKYVQLAGYSASTFSNLTRRSPSYRRLITPPFLRTAYMDRELLEHWWDSIALTDAAAEVLESLRILVSVAAITLVEDPSNPHRRYFVTRLEGRTSRQPLRSLGDGIERVFRTALALAYARHRMTAVPPSESERSLDDARDILLIDEIESGIHYSALESYWSAIFALARRFDVQVFATTHSWDCIEAFQKAATADTKAEGMLVRLERDGDDHRAVVIDEHDLEVVTRDNIEVR